jgi:hypothetical protein
MFHIRKIQSLSGTVAVITLNLVCVLMYMKLYELIIRVCCLIHSNRCTNSTLNHPAELPACVHPFAVS